MSTSTAVSSATIRDGPSADSVSPHAARDFLLALFRHLDDSSTRYCVLHSWENLPEELPSDLDIAVHPEDRKRLANAIALILDTDAVKG